MVFWQDQSVARHRSGVDLGMVGGKISWRLAVGDCSVTIFFVGIFCWASR